MIARARVWLQLSAFALTLLGNPAAALAGQNVFSVAGESVELNSKPFKVIGVRLSNGLVSDAKTQELIDNLDVFKAYGVNTVSVFFMGSRFGEVKGYLPDATLDPSYASRMAKVIEAADARGMVVLVGCLYWGTSSAKDALVGWQQAQANLAVANTVRWLSQKNYRNVFVDPDNEGMSPFTDTPLIDAAHGVDPAIMIACNRGSASISGNANDCAASADLSIHFGPQVAGKPWLQSEGVPDPANYWGAYSKTGNYNNYIRIGLYTSAMKSLNISDATTAIDKNAGYILASTWLQCGPLEGIGGPFMTPGGSSNVADVNANVNAVNADAGVKWWLDAMKATYGAWMPTTSNGAGGAGGAAAGGSAAGGAGAGVGGAGAGVGAGGSAGAAGGSTAAGGPATFGGSSAAGGAVGSGGGTSSGAPVTGGSGGLARPVPSPSAGAATADAGGCAFVAPRRACDPWPAMWTALGLAGALRLRRLRTLGTKREPA